FEQGTLVFATNPQKVRAAEALPGWTVFLNNTVANEIYYNDIALDLWAVSIHDSSSPFKTPISGNFSLFLQGGRNGQDVREPAAISQTGNISANARSLLFAASDATSLEVSLSGQLLPLIS